MISHRHSEYSTHDRPSSFAAWKQNTPRGIIWSSRRTVHVRHSRSAIRGALYPTPLAKLSIAVLALSATVLSMPRWVAAQTYEGDVSAGVSVQSEDHSMWEGSMSMAFGGLDVAQRWGMVIRMGMVGHKYYDNGQQVDSYQGIQFSLLPEFSLAGTHGMSQRFRLFLIGGPTIGWTERVMDDLEEDNRFELGLVSGAGLNLPLGERVALNVGAEYYLGLLQREPYGRDSALLVRFGLRFRGTSAG